MNLDRTISIILICIIVVGIIGLIYVLVNPFQGEKLTEFYILGADGNAGNYPTNLTLGDIGNVTVGIVNREQGTINYLLVIQQSNKTLKNENFTLKNGEQKVIPFSFIAGPKGQQKIEFNLYKIPDTNNMYRSLFLLVDVN